jgi:hypothetical protein
MQNCGLRFGQVQLFDRSDRAIAAARLTDDAPVGGFAGCCKFIPGTKGK